jgi:hypothetical protein
VNFAVAETGTLLLVENEGNGRMSTGVPPVHIAVTGIEKVVENLRDSAYLETVAHAPPLWLFRLRPEPPPDGAPVAAGISPVGSLWEAEHVSAGSGTRREDARASGGAVVSFPAGAAGVLNRPFPARIYPAGSYRVQTRFLAERPGAAPRVTLEVKLGSPGKIVASAGAPAGSDRGGVLDLEADFTLDTLGQVFVQVASDGSAPVRWDYALVRFAGAPEPQYSIEVEDLWHMGTPLADPEASGGQAVELRPGYHPRNLAFSGPDRVLPAGAWTAGLRFIGASPAAPAAGERFEVGLSNVERPLAAASLPGPAGSGGYQEVALPFDLSRAAPVQFRVYFPGRRRLVLDRVTIAPR